MRTFAQKPKAVQQDTIAKFTTPGRAHFEQSREVSSVLHLQRTIGNQAVQRLLQTSAGDLGEGEVVRLRRELAAGASCGAERLASCDAGAAGG